MEITDNREDTRLVVLLRSGDHEAFGALYRKYSAPIYKRLLKLTKTEHIAEELLQEIFVKVWEKRFTIVPELSFKAWLYKVAEHEVFSFYRQLGRNRRLQEQVIARFGEIALPSSENTVFLHERNELLYKAINQLPPQRREAFLLCRLEGKSYEEAGTIMGISPFTVSNHLVKANASVRSFLAKHRDSIFLFIPLLYQ